MKQNQIPRIPRKIKKAMDMPKRNTKGKRRLQRHMARVFRRASRILADLASGASSEMASARGFPPGGIVQNPE